MTCGPDDLADTLHKLFVAVRIAAGTDTAEIQIPIVNDARHEPTERFRVQLLDVHHGRLRDHQANAWIADDDGTARNEGR